MLETQGQNEPWKPEEEVEHQPRVQNLPGTIANLIYTWLFKKFMFWASVLGHISWC